MSQITNRIATVFTARDGGVRAMMNDLSGQTTGLGRSLSNAGRQGTYLSNQLRAVGTTLRYALAGTAVFGATTLIRNLSQLQTEFALLTSINPEVNQLGSNFTTFFDSLQEGSLKSLTPVNELASAAVNLVSSLDVSKDQITGITTTLAQGAQLAQAPVEDLTKGITGMIQAFGEAPTQRNVEGLTRGFITVTRRAPGGIAAGPQIIQQLGPAALAARLANISPQQLFGLITTVLRAGGSPATGMRGLNFLLQSIATPNKAEAKVLAGIGITPDFVQQQGGLAAIQKLVGAMRARGVKGPMGRNAPAFLVGDEQLDSLDAMGMQGLPGLGVSGQGLVLAQRAVGRIHGVRALIALLQQMNTGKFSEDVTAANNAITGMSKEGRPVADQFREFARQQPLRAASIALQDLANQAPKAFEGILDPIARRLTGLGQLAVDHPHGARRAMQIGGGFLAALGISNFFGLTRRIPGGLGKLLGRFSAGGMFTAETAVKAATNPERVGQIGATPQNPLFVIVVGQLFGAGGVGPSKGGGGLIKDAERLAEGAGAAQVARRGLPYLLRTGAMPAAVVTAAYSILTGKLAPGDSGARTRNVGPLLHRAGELYPHLDRSDPRRLIIDQLNRKKITDRQAEIQLKTAFAQANRLERLNRILAPFHRRDPLYGVTAIYSQKERMIHGKAVVELNVAMSTDKGVKRKKIQVPMSLYANGRNPSQRGQGGKTKADIP